MNCPIISSGIVCPGGFGSGALTAPWTLTTASDATGMRDYETFLVDRDAAELKRWQKEPRLRRASPISYYLLEAAHQALSAAPHVDPKRTGVVAALFLGCLVYSIRFYRQIADEGRRFASPLLFPETVFNSPLSHVVSTLGLGGPVYSQVGDTSCWATALRTARCWLANERADHVLILGAEEFEPHELDAFKVAGLFRPRLTVGEGAGAVLLARESGRHGVNLAAVADGHAFKSRKEAGKAAAKCLANLPSDCPLLPTATGWTERVVPRILRSRTMLADSLPNQCIAGTASCAWNTIFAANLLQNAVDYDELVVPYFGHSQQCAAAHLVRI